jgi:hypothetical protein
MTADDPTPATRPASWVVTCCVCRRVRVAAEVWADDPPPAGATVSHGFCPPCLLAQYPEFWPAAAPAPSTDGAVRPARWRADG